MFNKSSQAHIKTYTTKRKFKFNDLILIANLEKAVRQYYSIFKKMMRLLIKG